jgi:hypothetical protein
VKRTQRRMTLGSLCVVLALALSAGAQAGRQGKVGAMSETQDAAGDLAGLNFWFTWPDQSRGLTVESNAFQLDVPLAML